MRSGGGGSRSKAKRPFEEEADEEVDRLLAKYNSITFKKQPPNTGNKGGNYHYS